jgi:hypothetical protein
LTTRLTTRDDIEKPKPIDPPFGDIIAGVYTYNFTIHVEKRPTRITSDLSQRLFE